MSRNYINTVEFYYIWRALAQNECKLFHEKCSWCFIISVPGVELTFLYEDDITL